jgi:hypothetical protein
VLVALYAPDGRKVSDVDSARLTVESETTSMIADTTGTYRVEVRSPEKTANTANVPFQSNSEDIEWLNGLTFEVKNVSTKPIEYINMNLIFKFVDKAKDPAMTIIHKGQTHGPEGIVLGQKLSFLPGTSQKLDLPEKAFNSVMGFVKSLTANTEEIESITLEVGRVEFSDQTSWFRGFTFKRDPNNPARWLPDK